MNKRTVWADGERVRQLRRSQGWSQQRLAAKASIAKRTLESIENGRHAVLLHTLHAVAEALNVSPRILLPPDSPYRSSDVVPPTPAASPHAPAEIHCHLCRSANRPGRRFCAECGEGL